MSSITNSFKEAFRQKESRNWEKIFVLVDLHGTVLHSDYKGGAQRVIKYYNYALETLSYMTKRKDISLILWTSTPEDGIQRYLSSMAREADIVFDHINCNPEVYASDYADFSKKLYFNVALDDKAGFQPEIDWEEVLFLLQEMDLMELLSRHSLLKKSTNFIKVADRIKEKLCL